MAGPADFTSRVAANITTAAAHHATPFYLTDEGRLSEAASILESAFPEPWVRSYSLKADPLPAVVQLLAERGWGANCVSIGEIAAAHEAGVPNSRITLEGIGKGEPEFDAALHAAASGDPLRWVAIESADEARALADAVASRGAVGGAAIRILIRLNPAIEPGTHSGLAVGRESSKFGTDPKELLAAARIISEAGAPLQLIGIHLHAGSQIRNLLEWKTAVERSLAAYSELVESRLITDEVHRASGTLCVGGGEPISLDSSKERLPTADDFCGAADAAWSSAPGVTPLIRAIEPGRALVAEATLLISRVLHVRGRQETVIAPLALPGEDETRCSRQVILDAGMSELIRPALYGARHPLRAVTPRTASTIAAALHGPICESTDALGAHHVPADTTRGDLFLIEGSGAYADAMWSSYNGRPRPARLMVGSAGVRVVRERSAEST
jgi:diaminopimelate decarboxylase